MSLGDIVITAIIFLLQKLVIPVLPSSISVYPIDTFSSNLSAVEGNLTGIFTGIGSFIPVNMIFFIALIVIFAEMSLIIFKLGIFVINLIRGGGA